MAAWCGDLRLPIGAGLLQAAFIVLLGVFVRYDVELGMPHVYPNVSTTTVPTTAPTPPPETVREHLDKYYASASSILTLEPQVARLEPFWTAN